MPMSLPRPTARQGRRSIAFQARQSGRRQVVIKLTSQRNSYPVEAWVYRELAGTGVPVPEVRAYRARLPRVGLPCLVMSMIDGEPLFAHPLTQDAEQRLYVEVGGLLRSIHTVSLPRVRFGLGAFLPGRHLIGHADWHGFIAAYHAHPQSTRYLLAQGLLPGCTDADIGLLDAALSGHCFVAVLNHGDFGPDHILVRDARTVGIIDPGQAFAGPAEYDLAYLACYLSGTQFAHVLRGYDRQVDHGKIFLYQTVIAMHKAARAHRAVHGERAGHFSTMARIALSHLRSGTTSISGTSRI